MDLVTLHPVPFSEAVDLPDGVPAFFHVVTVEPDAMHTSTMSPTHTETFYAVALFGDPVGYLRIVDENVQTEGLEWGDLVVCMRTGPNTWSFMHKPGGDSIILLPSGQGQIRLFNFLSREQLPNLAGFSTSWDPDPGADIPDAQ